MSEIIGLIVLVACVVVYVKHWPKDNRDDIGRGDGYS